MAKIQRQILRIFHPIDKDERLLSVANNLEVLNAHVEGDCVGNIGEFPKT